MVGSKLAKGSLSVLTSINSVQTFRNTDDRICRSLYFSHQPRYSNRHTLNQRLQSKRNYHQRWQEELHRVLAELLIQRPYLDTASLGARVLQTDLFVMICVARQEGSYSLYQRELFLDMRPQFLEISN